MSSTIFMSMNERWSIRSKNEYVNAESTDRKNEIPDPSGHPVPEAPAEASLPLTDEEILEMLDCTNDGKVRQSIENAVIVLENDPRFAGGIVYNELTERIDIVRKMPWRRSGTMMDDTDEVHFCYYLEADYGLSVEQKVRNALKVVANKHSMHPIRDYLLSLTWDGKERVRYALHHFLGVDTSNLTYECLKLFMSGAIYRVFDPGCKFDDMLCLVGEQGGGKSSFFQYLAIKDEWFSDDLRKLDDENVFRKMQGHWIIEMSEMIATASAKSIEEIKGFLTRQKDTYKIPYDRQPKDRKRQCVFGGTSNNLNFLPFDRTGNRRFLPVLTDPDKAEVHILSDKKASREYIDQMWAEMMVLFLKGECSTVLPEWAEKELLVLQKEYMPEDTLTGIIQSFLDHYDGEYVCSALILDQALGKDPKRVKSYESREVNEIMNTGITGWIKYKQHRFRDYGQQRSWKRNPVPEDPDSGDAFVPVPEQMTIPFDNMVS